MIGFDHDEFSSVYVCGQSRAIWGITRREKENQKDCEKPFYSVHAEIMRRERNPPSLIQRVSGNSIRHAGRSTT